MATGRAILAVLAGAVLAARCGALPGQDAPRADEARGALVARHAAALAQLAAWCDQRGLKARAAETRAWSPPRDPWRLYLFDVPERMTPLPEGAGDDERTWRERLVALRRQQAAALWPLAREAIRQRRPSLVYELIAEAAREDPDHAAARRALGQIKTPAGWQTPYAARQADAGKVWHERFGWLPAGHVPRYEQGQRFYRNQWIGAAEEARLRSDIQRGWRIETEHYLVTTNHSLEEGVRLAGRLERFYRVWQNVFPRYLASEAELARRLDQNLLRPEGRARHNVVYYRDRQQYNAALKAAQPQIEITLGIYFDSVRTAYFFAGQEQDAGTMFHEATHQLFQETRPVARQVGRASHFWIIEAVACYVESLAEHDGYVTLGGLAAGRMPAARQRLLADDFQVPLAELAALGMNDLQRDPRLPRLYSQSAGLATMLMHADEGRYREALCEYLEAVYTGRADERTLPRLTAARYEDLDGRYRRFLEETSAAAGR